MKRGGFQVLVGIEKGLRGEVPMRLSIVSGHGIGKSAMLAIIIITRGLDDEDGDE